MRNGVFATHPPRTASKYNFIPYGKGIAMRILTFALAGTLALSGALPTLALSGADTAKPKSGKLGFDPSNMDTTCKPCDDFNKYVNGGWMARTPIPAAYPRWGSFNELQERNQTHLREILEAAAKDTSAKPGSIERKIGDFYAAAMDEAKIEELGATPLKPDFDRINAISDVKSLQETIAYFQSNGIRTMFGFGGGQDAKDSTQVIGQLSQGGLGLPEREFYFRDDPKSKSVREEYVKQIAKMFELLGDSPEAAAEGAQVVMKLETKLAEVSMTRVEQRNPEKTYLKKTRAELEEMVPEIDWKGYFTAIGAPQVQTINVRQPAFMQALGKMLGATPIPEWKTYLRWRVISGAAPLLSKKFVEQEFAFQGRILNGTTENLPREKRMTGLADRSLGEALGQIYVRKHFSPAAKKKVLELVGNIKAALRDDIMRLDWMSDETRKQAIAKLDAIVVKIAYPDQWIDYSSVKITRDSLIENVRACTKFAIKRNLEEIGKPVNRARWGMTPPTVNAYYSPVMNEIVFPAGILQPPFYDPEADDAVNYGGIGAVIGHEISHGFDDSGRRYDKEGNLKDWWTKADGENFDGRAKCIADMYSSFKVGDVNVNGKLTLGENIADLGGLTLAYLAYQKSLNGKPGPVLNGFTSDQRFFIGWAQVWRTNARPEFLRQQVFTDPHSPAMFRVNGTVSNMPTFAKAFNCPKGSPMVSEAGCRIW